MKKELLVMCAISLAGFSVNVFGDHHNDTMMKTVEVPKLMNIVENAVATPAVSTLVAAVQA
jgi:hypothetical protein